MMKSERQSQILQMGNVTTQQLGEVSMALEKSSEL